MGIVCGIVLLAVLAVLLFTGAFSGGERVVGKNISPGDVTEFYYTLSSSTNPPQYQRYRFTAQDGECRFFHETREGDHWPLTEKDVTRSGERTLTGEEWAAFFDCLRGGTVKARRDSADSGGSGPWTYLYWKGDRGRVQEYAFPTWAARAAFEEMCVTLREST